jgi:hypothetical protein
MIHFHCAMGECRRCVLGVRTMTTLKTLTRPRCSRVELHWRWRRTVSRLAANHLWPVAQTAIPQCLVPHIPQCPASDILGTISKRRDIQHSRDLLKSLERLQHRDARLRRTTEACTCTRQYRAVARPAQDRVLLRPASRITVIRSGSNSAPVESPGSNIRGFLTPTFCILLNLAPVVA